MTEKKKTIQINPLDITESLGYTTFRRDSRKPWTKEEDVRLSELVNEKLIELGYPHGIESLSLESWDVNQTQLPQEIDWESIGEILQTRKAKDCRKRWTNSLDPNLKKGKWTKEEDDSLLLSYNKHGSSWQKISLEIPGRTDDQCAKRYIEVLDPNTKDRLRPWKLDEDLQLIRKVKTYGTKWRTISLEMKSRPSLTCRNRWRKIVTEVVRGKASPDIKKELDSIQGGLSALEQINENLEKQRQTQSSDNSSGADKPTSTSNQDSYNRQKSHRNHINGSLSSFASTSNSNLPPGNGESPKPNSTEMDWKYTLKDTSGLTLSNGNISTTDLAKQLIENAKKYDLKISIHQHIHHHYAQSNSLGKGASPVESTTSQNSGHNVGEDLITPNRYSHFNYLPPMVQPQLGSSSTLMTKENDLARLLNPQNRQHHQDQSRSNHKRKLSGSSNNSRGKQRHTSQLSQNVNTLDDESTLYRKPSIDQDELEDELDFWETMRSLSEVTNNRRLNNTTATNPTNNNGNNRGQQQIGHAHQFNRPVDASNTPNNGDIGLYYSVFGEDDELEEDEFKEDMRDIEGLAGILPFNPS
ncbi:hypothetical protein BN7_2555 [Wickerhamomyces ciferrii]|uniref:Myb-like DNA-binding protein BAS1 n=1 Tax=Wickerhamomyces ciferrii (strain ATCC 14091 / BCRC 22168 / CBS 111 / JCM 3599 / NBRC 0793 / NRRL Y-1031 F-60-10) TaxID=1206466 RepID=K0KPD9_WICCF|nr:uncharacterized protein BN7_2555 [Wickerhamomyces ciferrii]CCH43008.1 hypothetical protein BN7_2555 [Wickerhamomyces ciferrii]